MGHFGHQRHERHLWGTWVQTLGGELGAFFTIEGKRRLTKAQETALHHDYRAPTSPFLLDTQSLATWVLRPIAATGEALLVSLGLGAVLVGCIRISI